MERAVENIDFAIVEISSIQESTSGAAIDRQTFVDRTMGRGIGVGNYSHNRGPLECRDCAVLTGEDKACGSRTADAIVHDKTGAAIEDQTRWIALRASRTWNGKLGYNGSGPNVVKSRLPGSVVRVPPRTCWTSIKTPGVNEVRIGVIGRYTAIRYEIVLRIEL